MKKRPKGMPRGRAETSIPATPLDLPTRDALRHIAKHLHGLGDPWIDAEQQQRAQRIARNLDELADRLDQKLDIYAEHRADHLTTSLQLWRDAIELLEPR